jgi:hypothetical protein
MSPAMAAHLTDRYWDIRDIVKLIEEWEGEKGNFAPAKAYAKFG